MKGVKRARLEELGKVFKIANEATRLERERIIKIIEEEFDKTGKLHDTAVFRYRVLERIKE